MVMSNSGIPCTVAHQAPLSMGFPRQEHWSGLPFPPPRNLPDPGIEPASIMSSALGGRIFTTSATWKGISSHPGILIHFSHVQLFAIPWTVIFQVPLSMGFSRQEFCNGLPCPPLGDFPTISSQGIVIPTFHLSPPWLLAFPPSSYLIQEKCFWLYRPNTSSIWPLVSISTATALAQAATTSLLVYFNSTLPSSIASLECTVQKPKRSF